MTVLAKYQRLEAEGLWRSDPEAQLREVIVVIGDATLTIAALNGTALSHWSLPATARRNPGHRPAIYSPGEGAPESLELNDSEMIDAIETVLKSIGRGAPHVGRLRKLGTWAVLLGVVAASVIWLPGAVTRYAASLVSEGARTEIGERLTAEMNRVAGTPCSDPAGQRSLGKLQARLFPDGSTRLLVLPSALEETAHLPGGTLLIGHKLVEDHETPEVLAGYLLAEDIRQQSRDPIEALLTNAGLATAFRLLTTGGVDDAALRLHAEKLVLSPETDVPDAALMDAMTEAQVSAAPYAFARDFSGETTLPLIEASKRIAPSPLLTDGDWLALQRICEG